MVAIAPTLTADQILSRSSRRVVTSWLVAEPQPLILLLSTLPSWPECIFHKIKSHLKSRNAAVGIGLASFAWHWPRARTASLVDHVDTRGSHGEIQCRQDARSIAQRLERRRIRSTPRPQGRRHRCDRTRCPRITHETLIEITDEQSIADAASSAKSLFPQREAYLHLALSIPGILYPEKSPSRIDYDDALETFRVNTLGPMMLTKHFFPFLPRKATEVRECSGLPPRATWANMSARVGSISDNGLGGWYSYRASKAALNQVTKTFDNYLRTSAGDKAIAIALHPGTVKTGLSEDFWANAKKDKLFSPEFAAEKLLEVVNTRHVEDRGRIWDWKGEEIPP